jgi:hypothetical protein
MIDPSSSSRGRTVERTIKDIADPELELIVSQADTRTILMTFDASCDAFGGIERRRPRRSRSSSRLSRHAAFAKML